MSRRRLDFWEELEYLDKLEDVIALIIATSNRCYLDSTPHIAIIDRAKAILSKKKSLTVSPVGFMIQE